LKPFGILESARTGKEMSLECMNWENKTHHLSFRFNGDA